MASPLPKMNAPAFRKNRPSEMSVPPTAVPVRTLNGTPRTEAPGRDDGQRRNAGGASSPIIIRPAATKSSAISAPVKAVTVKMTNVIPHRRTSL